MCVYVVNTCEYCLETIPKLHSQIEEKIEGFEIDLENACTPLYTDLINTVIMALVRSIQSRTDQVYV